MSKQAKHYIDAATRLTGQAKVRALRAAQNHLQPTDPGYMADLKKIQADLKKIKAAIIEALES